MQEQSVTEANNIGPMPHFVNAIGSPFEAGSAPSLVAIGDVNNDGNLDLVSANFGSNNLSVLLGYGNGTFASQQTLAVGDKPASVVIGDVNNDGNLDLVSANAGSDNLSILLGHGNGTFAPQQTFEAGSYPISVAIGDVNNDGKLDLVSANFYYNNLSVLLGHGNGRFAPQQTFEAGYNPQSVAIGDVNNDGNLDLVSANSLGNNLSVLLGHGNGTFASQQSFEAGSSPISVAIGDVNNDNKLDLVSANYEGDNLSVLLGHGNGRFAPQQTFEAGYNPQSVAIGDVNNDGNLDLVSANSLGNNLSVLLGYGNGTFASQQTFEERNFPNSVAIGDVNNDDKLDLVSANAADNLSVLLNESVFTNSSSIEEGHSNVTSTVKTRINPMTIVDENDHGNAATESDDKYSATDSFAASESSAASIKAILPDMTSSFMLGMVLAKMGANAVNSLVVVGKRWWQREAPAAQQRASIVEFKQAQATFSGLEARIDKLLSQEEVNDWYRYGLEDLRDELAKANKSGLSLAKVKEWQIELGELEADYVPAQAHIELTVKQAYSNSFFKPQQPGIMLEQAALSQAQAQPKIAA